MQASQEAPPSLLDMQKECASLASFFTPSGVDGVMQFVWKFSYEQATQAAKSEARMNALNLKKDEAIEIERAVHWLFEIHKVYGKNGLHLTAQNLRQKCRSKQQSRAKRVGAGGKKMKRTMTTTVGCLALMVSAVMFTGCGDPGTVYNRTICEPGADNPACLRSNVLDDDDSTDAGDDDDVKPSDDDSADDDSTAQDDDSADDDSTTPQDDDTADDDSSQDDDVSDDDTTDDDTADDDSTDDDTTDDDDSVPPKPCNSAQIEVYRDLDRDGFGSKLEGDSQLFCKDNELEDIPAGYVMNNRDCKDEDPNVNPNASEICDSEDNDCDDETDEGVKNACGKCGEVPEEVCTLPGETAEDEDCDKFWDAAAGGWRNIDEGCGCEEGDPPQTCGETDEGVCEYGTQDCEYDEESRTWQRGACNHTFVDRSDEICDGLDNDCDGDVDEDLGTTTCGTGTCQLTVQNCLNGVPQTCDAADPTSEICDGEDNDCDNEVDEDGDGGNVCPPTCTPSNGGVEICDGKDNDCINGIDRDAIGNLLCLNGCAPTNEGVEICDDVDNNCNGQIDDMTPITCGKGVCENAIPACVAGKSNTNECVPLAIASQETCTLPGEIAEDEDCDGFTDDQDVCVCDPGEQQDCVVSGGEGVCAMGKQTCGSGSTWGACVPNLPTAETCGDDLDNDCDGTIDNGCALEKCDGVDNNKDPKNFIDENCGPCENNPWIETDCVIGKGVCSKTGVRKCDPDDPTGQALACTDPVTGVKLVPAPKPVEVDLVCDGDDSDCDGVTDAKNFDFTTDHENCGGCGKVCPTAAFCIAGQCKAIDAECVEMIPNPDFEDGNFNHYRASYNAGYCESATSKDPDSTCSVQQYDEARDRFYLLFNLDSVPGAPKDQQLEYLMYLTQGQTYEVTVEVLASVPCTGEFWMMDHKDPWTGDGPVPNPNVMNLTTELQSFKFTITPTMFFSTERVTAQFGQCINFVRVYRFSMKRTSNCAGTVVPYVQ